MKRAVISGSGVYVPPDTISNDEIVSSFNAYVTAFNEQHAAEIAAGTLEALQPSSAEFIAKASGITNRFVMDKKGILDNAVMAPQIAARKEDELSLQAEFAVEAAKKALQAAHKTAADVDAVIFACSAIQRAYPAMSIEIQDALGIKGFAMDMNVACSSATFALQVAANNIVTNSARCVLIVSPELTTGHVNFKDRDSHFIFSDAAVAVVIESIETCTAKHVFEIISCKLRTEFSNSIRNDFGFLNRCELKQEASSETLFRQKGRKVFKEVVPMAANTIISHLKEQGLNAKTIKRLWLHQANVNMDRLIGQKVFERENISHEDVPIILNEYANTAAAGSIISFHNYHSDLNAGDYGVICSFGAGYSIGNIIVRKC